jgi:hypothetical protein
MQGSGLSYSTEQTSCICGAHPQALVRLARASLAALDPSRATKHPPNPAAANENPPHPEALARLARPRLEPLDVPRRLFAQHAAEPLHEVWRRRGRRLGRGRGARARAGKGRARRWGMGEGRWARAWRRSDAQSPRGKQIRASARGHTETQHGERPTCTCSRAPRRRGAGAARHAAAQRAPRPLVDAQGCCRRACILATPLLPGAHGGCCTRDSTAIFRWRRDVQAWAF